MYTLTYDKNSTAYSDSKAEETAYLLNSQDVKTSTENVILAARVLYKERKILKFEIVYSEYYEDGTNSLLFLDLNEDGRLDEWPKGFCDVIDNLLNRILDI